MLSYIAKRLLQTIPVLLGVSLITYLLIFAVAGDPARLALGVRGDQATVASLRHQMGLDDPLIIQYGRFLWKALQGDLGRSFSTGEAVLPAIMERFPATLRLGLVALLLSMMVGIPLGLVSAVFRNRWPDHTLRFLALLGISTPSFFLGIILAWVFGYVLNLTPISGYMEGLDGIPYYTLPVLALSLGPIAVFSRLTRSSVLDVLEADYIRAARARGVRPLPLILKHILKNALIPVITTIGGALAGLLSGAFFIEFIFNWPGVGLLAVDSISNYDIPMVQGTVLFSAILFVTSNILVDVAYTWADPRVRL